MLKTTLVLSACAVAASIASIAQAASPQPLCTDRKVVLSQLSKQYSEAPVAMGIANNGGVLEILSSSAGKSWTIIVTMPNGMSCMIAAGENWESVPQQAKIDPPA